MAPHSSVQGTGFRRTVLCIRTSILLAILYTFGFFVLASSQIRQHGFPLDDSYIYQTVARGLAHGTSGFVPGQHAGGATSFLWVYLQVINYMVFHGFDPVVYNLVLSWLLLLLIGQLLFAIASQDGLPPRSCWVIAVSPAVCGNFLWLGMIGMEHLLFLALSLAAVYFWFLQKPEQSKYSAVCAGISLGLLATTRPEAIAFGPVLIVMGARKAERTLSDATRALLLWLAGVTVYFTWSLYNFHSLMPSTLKGRSWLWFQTYGGPHSAKAIAGFFRQWLQRLPRQFSAHFVETQMRLTPGNRLFTVLVLLILIFIAIGFYGLVSQRSLRMKSILLLAGMHASLYLVLLPATGHGGRYQPLLLLLLFPLFFLGMDKLLKSVLKVERTVTFAIAMLIAIAGSASLYAWRSVTIIGTELINETHGQMATWIQQHLPPQTRVAAFDSGRISYDLPYPVTDMGGLADKAFLPYLTTGHVSQYLELHGVRYFVIPELKGQSLPLFSAAMPQTMSVAKFCASPALFENGYAYTSHAWRCQHLYQLSQP